MTEENTNHIGRFDPICMILGWILPGLGHIWIRQPRRGGFIMAGVLSMFFVGVLVGGVHVVDRKDATLWFLPQAMNGPVALGADYLNQNFVKTGIIGTRSLNKVADLGTLFVALGGLMNLATMIDAATRPTNQAFDAMSRRERRRQPEEGSA